MLQEICRDDFDAVFALMESAFPADERRSREGQWALFDRPDYNVWGVYAQDGRLAAFLAGYDLGDTLFLEHFAVHPAYRNQGLGAKILAEIAACTAARLCLEAELPENDLAARRIGFYRRNGFFENPYPYTQPSLGAGRAPVPLVLMTTGSVQDPNSFVCLRDRILREVYGK